MKKITLVSLLAACFALAGCSSLDSLYSTQSVVTPPLTNEVVNVTPQQTNAVTGEITPPMTNVTQIVIPAMTNAVLVPNASISEGIAASGALPIPFAGVGAIALGFLYSCYAAFRNKKLASALVTGIEAGRQILQQTPEGQALDAKLKDALIQHQDIAGVINQASALVNDLTANTVK